MNARSPHGSESMAQRCPTCESIYGDSVDRCPDDDTALEPCDPEDDELLGEVVDGRFRLDGLLGAGGMGRVYRGTQLSVDREVAVKIIRGEAVPDRRMRERFIREARVISEFGDPNIIRLIDFGQWDQIEAPYLVMEFAGGVSLADLVDEGRLDPALAVEIARQVCSGLVEAHGAEVVHRDLKPDNLHLIDRADGSFLVKILDFGIAYPRDSSKNLTASGMMCGTAAYVSPEQAHGADLDGRADLYSLGIILFEMLTGLLPFRGESGFELLMQQVEKPPPDLNQYVPADALPPDLVRLVYELLEKNPDHRPQSAEAVRDRLQAIAEELETSVELSDDRSGAALYGSWVSPAVPEGAPIHDSDTRAADAEPAPPTEATEDAPPPANPWAETANRESSETAHPGAESRPSSGSSAPGGPDSTVGEVDSRLVQYGLPFLVGVAGVVAVTWMLAEFTGSAGGSGSTKSGNDPGSVAAADTSPLQPVGGSPEAHTGRCVGIGRSQTDLRSVYFYPDLDELLLVRSEGLEWRRLEVAGRRGDRLHFEYGAEGTGEADGSVLASGDKRVYRFDDGSEFTCRHESWGAYFEDLGLGGEWRSGEGDWRLEFPDTGQRFTFRPAGGASDAGRRSGEMQYRILTGSPDGDDVSIAAAPAGREGGDWQRWQLERVSDEEALRMTRAGDDGEEREYRFERPDEGADDGGDPPEKTGARPTAQAPSQATSDSNAEPSAEPSPGGSPRSGAAPTRGSGSGSSPMREAWRSRLDRILEKCRRAAKTIRENNDRYERLAKQGRDEAAKRAREKRDRENPKAVDTLQKMGSKISELANEMTAAGAPGHLVRSYMSEYMRECDVQ